MEFADPAYEIAHVRTDKTTKLIMIPEAKNTLLHVIVGDGTQSHILIKMIDLLDKLQEMGVVEGKDLASPSVPEVA